MAATGAHFPSWLVSLLCGDDDPRPYGLLSAPRDVPNRVSRQQRRHAAREAAKGRK